jgi:hypothetical protein
MKQLTKSLLETSYGGPRTLERFFENRSYKGANHFSGDIRTAMEDRAERAKKEFPEAVVVVIPSV